MEEHEFCIDCEETFEVDEGIKSYASGEFYCSNCWTSNDLEYCTGCDNFVDGLENDGLCEGCSPDEYWKTPDFMDSYDPD